MEPIGCPGTSAGNYHHLLRNKPPEEGTDRLSRNVDNKLPLLGAQQLRIAQSLRYYAAEA